VYRYGRLWFIDADADRERSREANDVDENNLLFNIEIDS